MAKESERPRATRTPKLPGVLTKSRVVKSSKSSSEEKKDQISVRDAVNKTIHKFACNTCIQGHRAPLCDPSKHRNKILIRRPTPGRPPRSCGHTHLSHCECRAPRKMCCVLSSEQWDQLIAGEIPTAIMYESTQALEEAQRALRHANAMYQQYGQNLQAFRPSHLGMTPVWPSQMVGFGQPLAIQPGYPAYPHALPNAYGMPAHQSTYPVPWAATDETQVYGGQMNDAQWNGVQMNGTQTSDAQVNGGQMHGVQNAQAYTNFAAEMPAPPPHLQLSQFQPLHPQPGMPFAPSFATYDAQPLMMPPNDFNMDMVHEEEIAAQPSSNPSQSCCSSRPQPPPQPQQSDVQTMQAFNVPSTVPSQFGCARCASWQCQCTNCPEVRQAPSGAWAQACGRGGHLDDTVRPKLEYNADEEQHDTPAEQIVMPSDIHQLTSDLSVNQLYASMMPMTLQDPASAQFQGTALAHLQSVDRVEELPGSSPCATNNSTIDFGTLNDTMDPRIFEWNHQH